MSNFGGVHMALCGKQHSNLKHNKDFNGKQVHYIGDKHIQNVYLRRYIIRCIVKYPIFSLGILAAISIYPTIYLPK